MWYGEEIQYTHERDDYDFYRTGQYTYVQLLHPRESPKWQGIKADRARYHAWESLAMKYLEKLSPKSIREENNSFNRMVRP
jgi:murein endopeptidase